MWEVDYRARVVGGGRTSLIKGGLCSIKSGGSRSSCISVGWGS